jgi:hypothetical protein
LGHGVAIPRSIRASRVLASPAEAQGRSIGDSGRFAVSSVRGRLLIAHVVPTCLALVLCNAVKRAGRGQEPSVDRAFTSFDVLVFPASTQPFSVWLQVTDGNGRAAMQLIIEHVPPGDVEAELVLPVEFSLHFQNPNEVLEHEAAFDGGIVLEKSGRYRLRLTADGISIAHRYFVAQLTPGGGAP